MGGESMPPGKSGHPFDRELDMTNRRFVLAVLILNTLATIGVFLWAFGELVAWQITFFYGNKEHIDDARLGAVRGSVEHLFYSAVLPLLVTSFAWFILACWMLAKSKTPQH